MKILLITFSSIAVLVVLAVIDYLYGKKKHLSGQQKQSYSIQKANIKLFTSGEPLFKQLFQDISSAKHHVHIVFYYVKKDQISFRFMKLLKKKAEEGLDVRLLVDWAGAFKMNKAMREDLKLSGVKIALSRVPKFPFLFKSQQRNHRKITVIDGAAGYLGGFNVGKEYVDQNPMLSPWRDYHLKITGPAVEDLQQLFFKDWEEANGEKMQYRDIFRKEHLNGDHQVRFFPTDGAFLEEEYIRLMDSAESSIIVGTPYFIPSPPLLKALERALERKVSIQIIVPAASDHPLVKEASYPSFRRLIPLGAKVHQYQNGFFHAKYILIDDAFMDIGTANFDKRSLFLNSEVNCYLYDKEIVDAFKQEVEKDVRNSTLMKLEDLHSAGLWTKLKESTAALLSPFL